MGLEKTPYSKNVTILMNKEHFWQAAQFKTSITLIITVKFRK